MRPQQPDDIVSYLLALADKHGGRVLMASNAACFTPSAVNAVEALTSAITELRREPHLRINAKTRHPGEGMAAMMKRLGPKP